jgi:hypothetical protein
MRGANANPETLEELNDLVESTSARRRRHSAVKAAEALGLKTSPGGSAGTASPVPRRVSMDGGGERMGQSGVPNRRVSMDGGADTMGSLAMRHKRNSFTELQKRVADEGLAEKAADERAAAARNQEVRPPFPTVSNLLNPPPSPTCHQAPSLRSTTLAPPAAVARGEA